MTIIHKHFTSTTEYAAWATQALASSGRRFYYSRDDPSQANAGLALLTRGDDTHVSEAQALIDQLSLSIEAPQLVWQHAVAGCFPDMPAYWAGEPEHMWTRTPVLSDRSPLRVWLGVTSTWNVTEAQLRKRGITLAAFVIAMAEVRPVYVTPFVSIDNRRPDQQGIISWDIRSAPLVLAELLASVADPLITRHLAIPSCFLANPELDLPSGPFHAIKRDHLSNIAPDDLYIPHIHSRDPLLDSPIKWLKDNIAKYGDPDAAEQEAA